MEQHEPEKDFQPITNDSPQKNEGQPQNQPQEVEIATPEETPQKKKQWLWIIVYLILFAAGVLGVLGFRMWFSK
jgi:hypothetical protein